MSQGMQNANCPRCGKLIGNGTMGTILPLCQCDWADKRGNMEDYLRAENAKLRDELAKASEACSNNYDAIQPIENWLIQNDLLLVTHEGDGKEAGQNILESVQAILLRAEAAEAKLKAASDPIGYVTHQVLIDLANGVRYGGARITPRVDEEDGCVAAIYADPVPPVDVQELQSSYGSLKIGYEKLAQTTNRLYERIAELERMWAEQHTCRPHPDAPHGFDRNASHQQGRYVCECEGWMPEDEKC